MNKLMSCFSKNSGKILAGMISAYVVAISAVCFCKYQHFLYGGLDLAIFNNALFNTLHGNWFWSSIQGHNYWGDHFEPLLVVFLPIYYLWQSPVLLLILQTIFLGLAAWPLYLVVIQACPECSGAESREPVPPSSDFNYSECGSKRDPSAPPMDVGVGRDKPKIMALGVAFLWLINPLVHNLNLFEFHAIAFFPFFFFSLFYFYLQLKESPANKKLLSSFYILIFLCLMVREDITFIILTFIILIWLDALKNKNKAFLLIASYGLLITIFYLIISFKIIAHFSPSGFSPFGYYYGWLARTNILGTIKHFLTLTNLEMILGFLAPFLFLPIIKPKWLLLTTVPLTQIIFSAGGGGALVWQMHYGALFLPALIIAFIYAFLPADNFINKKLGGKYLLLILALAANFCLWPSFGILKNDFSQTKNGPDLDQIERGAAVMSSFNYLPNLSSRKNIYSLHYYFLGVQQFAQADYSFKLLPEYILLDEADYKYYDEILKTSAWAGKYYSRGYKRLEEILDSYKKIESKDGVSLWKKI
ncbi:DUF2079 domain-containing protein [Candidatus Kuenenbacteria bacterium]|nr:DUF2079 domain-containing protein [Candidatus Kuenenbacteria bacterium]